MYISAVGSWGSVLLEDSVEDPSELSRPLKGKLDHLPIDSCPSLIDLTWGCWIWAAWCTGWTCFLGSRGTGVLESVGTRPSTVASGGLWSGCSCTRQDTSSICHKRCLTLQHSQPVFYLSILSSDIFFYFIFKFAVCPLYPGSLLQYLFAESCIFVPIAIIFHHFRPFVHVTFGVLFKLALHILICLSLM